MSDLALHHASIHPASAQLDRRAALRSIALLALTAVHHAYGGIVYRTPWRIEVAYFALIGALLIGALFYASWKFRHGAVGAIAGWAGIVAAAIPVGFLGVFEGAYNHVLKNVLYFGGLPMGAFRALFPAPTYELPSDLFFEVTGCAHVFLALLAGFALVAAIRWRFQ